MPSVGNGHSALPRALGVDGSHICRSAAAGYDRVARRAMLERNQLHPLVERVLAQAGPATGHGLEPTVFLHAEGGWVVQALDGTIVRPAAGRAGRPGRDRQGARRRRVRVRCTPQRPRTAGRRARHGPADTRPRRAGRDRPVAGRRSCVRNGDRGGRLDGRRVRLRAVPRDPRATHGDFTAASRDRISAATRRRRRSAYGTGCRRGEVGARPALRSGVLPHRRAEGAARAADRDLRARHPAAGRLERPHVDVPAQEPRGARAVPRAAAAEGVGRARAGPRHVRGDGRDDRPLR